MAIYGWKVSWTNLLIFNMRDHVSIARISYSMSKVASTQVVVILNKYFRVKAHLLTHSAFPWALCHCLKTPVSEMHWTGEYFQLTQQNITKDGWISSLLLENHRYHFQVQGKKDFRKKNFWLYGRSEWFTIRRQPSLGIVQSSSCMIVWTENPKNL